ncbi:unnamed protein product [Didymodactylos carnosus]|uniref:Uncharacterized protein n=1 Tax=Didymodactylos carnosus TaxID=1234261 RepID=A0A815Y020_9BILA|nr:unnamed protein product [Didymodactylos carnosus]CAF1563946.1 unnamed protein product [Didymodactylos carnosus]CAF3972406.1 unnamed protein product [Didymodactylos carnosus]CAF4425821.1 unnamed protein product [Didymodactylos carnosus]
MTYEDSPNPNTIDIRMVENISVWHNSGFDTAYPMELHGVINSYDFQQSITNINRSFPKSLSFRLGIAAICLLVALIKIDIDTTNQNSLPPSYPSVYPSPTVQEIQWEQQLLASKT